MSSPPKVALFIISSILIVAVVLFIGRLNSRSSHATRNNNSANLHEEVTHLLMDLEAGGVLESRPCRRASGRSLPAPVARLIDIGDVSIAQVWNEYSQGPTHECKISSNLLKKLLLEVLIGIGSKHSLSLVNRAFKESQDEIRIFIYDYFGSRTDWFELDLDVDFLATISDVRYVNTRTIDSFVDGLEGLLGFRFLTQEDDLQDPVSRCQARVQQWRSEKLNRLNWSPSSRRYIEVIQ